MEENTDEPVFDGTKETLLHRKFYLRVLKNAIWTGALVGVVEAGLALLFIGSSY